MKILKIGKVDVSDICQVGLSIQSSPVYDSTTFTNMLGQEISSLLGISITIQANFDGVDQQTAAKILGYKNAESVSVTYRYPDELTDTFRTPAITGVMDYEDSEGIQHWNISISMTCPLSGEGL